MSDDNSFTIVSHGVCDTVAFFENGAKYSVLAPRDTICPGHHTTQRESVIETTTMIEITMFVGLIFLLIVMAEVVLEFH